MHGAGPAPQTCSLDEAALQGPLHAKVKPPGRSLMSVRGNAAPRGMTAHDRIRLTGSSCRMIHEYQPRPEISQPGLTTFRGFLSRSGKVRKIENDR